MRDAIKWRPCDSQKKCNQMETMPFFQTARLKATKVQGRGKRSQSYMSPFVIVCLLNDNMHRHTQTSNRTSSDVPTEGDRRLYQARSLQSFQPRELQSNCCRDQGEAACSAAPALLQKSLSKLIEEKNCESRCRYQIVADTLLLRKNRQFPSGW